MKKTILSLSLGLALAGVAGHAGAEKADRNKPMNVEADALRYDDLKQVSVFTGNVVLTKGSIIIRGAQLEVRQDPDGYQHGLVTGSASTPAFFRQKRDGVDEYIEGDGETIEYDGRADTVRFLKKAQLRRLRGATLADEVSGASILYENLSDKFTVDGAPKTAAAPAGRVRAMLTPKPEAQAPLAPQPSPTLRTTPQLEKAAQ
ncbi:lipopolysaccharide transport periplasmic protein LptA [uncultured Rhodoferax sp.]|uniref:lipopolysaccharide transport periplasmic protein LptA n=1 Tax=uncultured Rhodoferax sp. TaxID=223188 RepID=UPI0025E5F35F|nr:lipopolysaccharide transport periplasmic protein LptA [uncultured Rhodoferax sp.]